MFKSVCEKTATPLLITAHSSFFFFHRDRFYISHVLAKAYVCVHPNQTAGQKGKAGLAVCAAIKPESKAKDSRA